LLLVQARSDDIEQLRNSMYNLQNLSEQLDPLESAYADVRFFDVGVEQTQQQFDVSSFKTWQNLFLFS
jgi:hypothetical protein